MTDGALTARYNVKTCIDCDRCADVCPVRLEDARFSPSGLVKKLSAGRAALDPSDFTLLNCLGCGACKVRCPVERVEFGKFVRELRASVYKGGCYSRAAHGGALHHLMAMEVEPETAPARREWVPEKFQNNSGEEILFVGCLPCFDIFFKKDPGAHPLSAAASALSLLAATGIRPRVPPNEPCCGHDLYEIGDRKGFLKKARAVARAFEEAGARRVLTICPECAAAIGTLYPEHGINPGVEVVPVSEVLAEKLGPTQFRETKQTVALHLSCRGFGSGEALKKLLSAVPGVDIREAALGRTYPACCGTSGFFSCGKISRKIALRCLREAEAAGASTLLTDCPKAAIHLRCAARPGSWVETRIEVEDFLTFLGSALKNGDEHA
jgi:Fe-S oxidoreductase